MRGSFTATLRLAFHLTSPRPRASPGSPFPPVISDHQCLLARQSSDFTSRIFHYSLTLWIHYIIHHEMPLTWAPAVCSPGPSTWAHTWNSQGFPCGSRGKEPACQCRRHGRHKFDLWVGKIPWTRKWQPTALNVWFLAGQVCPRACVMMTGNISGFCNLGVDAAGIWIGGGQRCCEQCQDSPAAKNLPAPVSVDWGWGVLPAVISPATVNPEASSSPKPSLNLLQPLKSTSTFPSLDPGLLNISLPPQTCTWHLPICYQIMHLFHPVPSNRL